MLRVKNSDVRFWVAALAIYMIFSFIFLWATRGGDKGPAPSYRPVNSIGN